MGNVYEKFEVVITAIVRKDGKYLVVRRSKDKKRFPGFWTVPGGHLETKDYMDLPKDSEHYWYNVLEKTLKREVKEESGIDIDNIEYVTSLSSEHSDGNLSIVISCMADFINGEVKLQPGETDACSWVSLEEAKGLQLIDGIYDELVMADMKSRGQKVEWKRFN